MFMQTWIDTWHERPAFRIFLSLLLLAPAALKPTEPGYVCTPVGFLYLAQCKVAFVWQSSRKEDPQIP